MKRLKKSATLSGNRILDNLHVFHPEDAKELRRIVLRIDHLFDQAQTPEEFLFSGGKLFDLMGRANEIILGEGE